MSPLLYVVAGVLVVLALFVARGVYLIGSGADVEYEARDKASGNTVATSGFALLDTLRHGEVPLVSQVEALLGRDGDAEQRARCQECRHVWLSGQPTSQPICPNCGSEETRLVADATEGST